MSAAGLIGYGVEFHDHPQVLALPRSLSFDLWP
jgi:hypothetical protein